MMKMVMSENAPVNKPPESFIGSMKGTMEMSATSLLPSM